MEPLRIGIVGCGNISGIYLRNLGRFRSTQVIAVADLDLDRARKAAQDHAVPDVFTTEQLLGSPDVELVLNLTIPKAHAPLALAAVGAGKHVYSEKPIAIQPEEAAVLIQAAESKGVRVACAPDTFLGGGIQTCRDLIDNGVIGEPVAAQAFMLCRGHESWHPAPEFYYESGGGPMLDMGPYYVTALINLLGPARRLGGSTRASFRTRTITSRPKHGKVVDVETPTHLSGEIDFEQGTIAHITQSFDVYPTPLQPITIFGSEGTLLVPDPNGFGGEVLLRTAASDGFEQVPLTHGFTDNWRGLGVLDLAYAIRDARPARASGHLALHALEIMTGFERSSDEDRHIQLSSRVDKPKAMNRDEFAGEAQ